MAKRKRKKKKNRRSVKRLSFSPSSDKASAKAARFGASNSVARVTCKLAKRGRREEEARWLVSTRRREAEAEAEVRGGDTRSSIPVHTRRNASTREENAGLSSTLDTLRPYTCRKELSKISNPTNLVGELPSRWCTPSVRISLRPAGNLFLLYVRRIYIRDSSHHGQPYARETRREPCCCFP